MSEPPEEPKTAVSAPRALTYASWLVVLEGVLVIGFGVVEAFHISSRRVQFGVTASLFFVAYGAALCWCGWGLAHVRRWSRGPLLFSQLVMLGLAVNFWQSERRLATVVLVVLAVGTLAGMLTPASVAALEGEDRTRGD